MKYKFVDEILNTIENTQDKSIKIAILANNRNNANLKGILKYLYDYRYNFETRKLPDIKKGSRYGWEIHSALNFLESRINVKLMGANKKFDIIEYAISQLSEKDGTILERLLTHNIDLGLSISEIQNVYPDILSFPEHGKKTQSIMELSYPGYLIKEGNFPLCYLLVYANKNFKLVTKEGHALIFQDKPNSVFSHIASKITPASYNVVFECAVFAATKRGDIDTSSRKVHKLFNIAKSTEYIDDNFRLKILDTVDLNSYYQRSFKPSSLYSDRISWLTSQNFQYDHFMPGPIFEIQTAEDLRKIEDQISVTADQFRFYGKNDSWEKGYTIIDRSLL